MIAALFVETNGCYFNLPDVDPWDITRDARQYRGPHPVVAHPPCQRWGRYASKNGATPGADEGCFAAALDALDRYGGVLEHPAHSLAWVRYGISPPPASGGWVPGLLPSLSTPCWTCQVEQGHYGHVARKATWLYCVSQEKPPDLIWGPSPQRLPAKRLAERGYESARRCGAVANQSSQQRQRTPIPFRDVLLSIARSAGTTQGAQV